MVFEILVCSLYNSVVCISIFSSYIHDNSASNWDVSLLSRVPVHTLIFDQYTLFENFGNLLIGSLYIYMSPYPFVQIKNSILGAYLVSAFLPRYTYIVKFELNEMYLNVEASHFKDSTSSMLCRNDGSIFRRKIKFLILFKEVQES